MTQGKHAMARHHSSCADNIDSMNCRLPQTPRSPAQAAAHYFDDVFSRQRRASLGGSRRPNSVARSMTRTRSIGARSDWASTNGANTPAAPSTTGDNDDDDGEEDPKAKGGPSRQWSIYNEDPSEKGKKPVEDDPDDPINKYVADQLQRLKTNESAEMAEEIAAQNDGADEL